MGTLTAHQQVKGLSNSHHCIQHVCDSCPKLRLLPAPKKLLSCDPWGATGI